LYETKQQSLLLRCLNYLTEAYDSVGNTTKAFGYLQQYTALSDTFNQKQQKEEIRNYEIQRKVEQIESQKEMLTRDITILNQRVVIQLIVIGSLVILALLLMIYYFNIRKKKNKLFEQVQELTNINLKVLEETGLLTVLPLPENQPVIIKDAQQPVVDEKPRIKRETVILITGMLQTWIRDKGFLNHITLNELAVVLNTNAKYLSEVIIQELKYDGFNGFLNKMRIHYLLTLVEEDPVYLNYKIDSLAGMLGYGSKTTFIKAFAEITGLTPSYYLNRLRQKAYLEHVEEG
jgi:YesN/AraC family two-component response regulator